MNTAILSRTQIYDLFSASVENAHTLSSIAIKNLESNDTRHVSLGLSELALEEYGKSFTCLAYYNMADGPAQTWKVFWKELKSHKIKAHRGYFYEFFCLTRVEIEGETRQFPTTRTSIPAEKEVSFYVNFDEQTGKVEKPFTSVGRMETYDRVASLIGPMNAAERVKMLLDRNPDQEYWNAVSDYAFMAITSNMFQEDVEGVLKRMANGSASYDKALEDIWTMFSNTEEI